MSERKHVLDPRLTSTELDATAIEGRAAELSDLLERMRLAEERQP